MFAFKDAIINQFRFIFLIGNDYAIYIFLEKNMQMAFFLNIKASDVVLSAKPWFFDAQFNYID